MSSWAPLPMVFGEHAVHLSYLFMGTKAFGNHLLYSRRCRQLQLGFRGSPPASHKLCRVSRQHFAECPLSSSQQFARGPCGIARASSSAACASASKSSSGRLLLVMVKATAQDITSSVRSLTRRIREITGIAKFERSTCGTRYLIG